MFFFYFHFVHEISFYNSIDIFHFCTLISLLKTSVFSSVIYICLSFFFFTILFFIYLFFLYYTCFNAILSNHPPSISHRVQKTVLYICISFAVLIQVCYYHLSKFQPLWRTVWRFLKKTGIRTAFLHMCNFCVFHLNSTVFATFLTFQ